MGHPTIYGSRLVRDAAVFQVASGAVLDFAVPEAVSGHDPVLVHLRQPHRTRLVVSLEVEHRETAHKVGVISPTLTRCCFERHHLLPVLHVHES